MTWSEKAAVPVGAIVPVDRVYGLGHDWYSGRFDADWVSGSEDDVEATFARHGLVGEFWSLKRGK